MIVATLSLVEGLHSDSTRVDWWKMASTLTEVERTACIWTEEGGRTADSLWLALQSVQFVIC